MPNIITVKIDMRKLDEGRFFQAQSGALYCELVLLPLREPGRYGDTHLVKQSATKEERANKVQLPIVGNATERTPASEGHQSDAPAERHEAPPPRSRRPLPPPTPANTDNQDEDIPF